MAASKNTLAVDRITPKQVGGLRIVFPVTAADEVAVTLASKGDNDYITKKQFNDNVTIPPTPSPITITAGITATPLTIAYTGNASTSYALRRASDNSYDWNTNVQYDGLNFVIYGADDGTGHFSDSYIFGIKP